MTIKFNVSRLKEIYMQAMESSDKSLAVDVKDKRGKGRYLLMMFLSEEDKESQDMLFIYMRNTKVLKKFKTYGSHKNGDFYIYVTAAEQKYFMNEAQIVPSDGTFEFEEYLHGINENIPPEIKQASKIKLLRENKDLIYDEINEGDKTEFLCLKQLTGRKPRDKTLRKMYIYFEDSVPEIDKFIQTLKNANCTVAWTTKERMPNAIRRLSEIDMMNKG